MTENVVFYRLKWKNLFNPNKLEIWEYSVDSDGVCCINKHSNDKDLNLFITKEELIITYNDNDNPGYEIIPNLKELLQNETTT